MENLNEKSKIIGQVRATVRDAITGEVKRVYKEQFNLITTVGRTVIARRLANDTTYTGIINYCAVGTGTNAADNADTTLQTEIYRKAVSSATYVTNVAYISIFYAAGDFNNAGIKEFGTFIDGTGVADSGQLFTRLAVVWSKTNTETLTCDITYTVA